MIRRLARFPAVAGGSLAAVLTAVRPAGACVAVGIPFAPKLDLSTMPTGIQRLSDTILTGAVIVLVLGGIVAIIATVAARRAQTSDPDGTASGMQHVARIGFAAAGIAALPLLVGMALAFGSSLTC